MTGSGAGPVVISHGRGRVTGGDRSSSVSLGPGGSLVSLGGRHTIPNGYVHPHPFQHISDSFGRSLSLSCLSPLISSIKSNSDRFRSLLSVSVRFASFLFAVARPIQQLLRHRR